MSSPWCASQRYQLVPAPGGLALVQDFLNTAGIEGYGPDLLADSALADDWVAGAVRAWSAARGLHAQPPPLGDADLSRLRALRETIAQLVAGEPPTGRGTGPVAVSLTLSKTGEVRLEPTGAGWRWLASALWGEVLLGQQDGTWRRIKRCHNPQCASTFYDRSKNNSGVWHDVKTCGNAANLRASRARRRQRDSTAQRPARG
ncbi:peptide chain release factor 2 [Mycobacterium sp. 852002-50816_SCH5313054-b]|uniref:CGNR zinc finger domain-containing protein n=1 Tax=Mycobacterium sp. 852002-50816_SCH5313054-b TaxID=1834092 RepID=UPI000801D5BA|nr:CGNR zinc finger domain-containing protein [Mycobacterium sp. 852002-50816_SCH5313054-b]OBF46259.1 peptide chain release factor 2 [Mycobacterium sp. 852002-50816_SCH5313054-b]